MAIPIQASGYASQWDYDEAHDTGSILVEPFDPPAWFTQTGPCPVCGAEVADHEAVQVVRASGDIFACLLNPDGEWQKLPEDHPEPWL